MSRLLAYIANDPDRVRCALNAGRKQLVADPSVADSWGVGFYQGGEVLLQRRPKRPSEPIDFYEATAELRTDVVIGHVRTATVGVVKNENTHPFRFRSWLFAHHGTIADYEKLQPELLAAVPDFLRRNIRGQTDSEHLFHIFLACLHDANKLDDPMIPPKAAAEALRKAVGIVENIAGAGTSELSVAVTNGRVLLATRVGKPVYMARVNGVRDCPVCRPAADFGREPKRVDHEHLRATMLVADVPPPVPAPWEEVADRSLVAVHHDLTVEVSKL